MSNLNGELSRAATISQSSIIDSTEENTKCTFGKCKICGDSATGIHYGVITCEGCKGFYKRSLSRNEYYVCIQKGNCLINKITRNRCKACRFKKCELKGMSIDCIRMGRIPKTEKFKAPNTADNDMIYDEIIEFRLPSQLVNEGVKTCFDIPEFFQWLTEQEEETKKTQTCLSLSLKDAQTESISTEYEYHIKKHNILKHNFLFEPIEILPSTSLKDEDLVVFVSFLKNSVYQVYKEHIPYSYLMNNTNYCLNNKNYIGPERDDISDNQVWEAFMYSLSEHTRWSTRFLSQLPGFNKLNNNDLTIIIQKTVLYLFSLQTNKFYRENENYTIIGKNGIQFTRTRCSALFGPLLTNLLFKMHRCLRKLNLSDYELALFYTLIFSSVNDNQIEAKNHISQFKILFRKALSYEFELNGRDALFYQNLNKYFKIIEIFDLNRNKFIFRPLIASDK